MNRLTDSKRLLAAIFLFIFLDLSVLAINYWIASEVSHDAVSINLAGRQRMLSQRITKTLLQLRHPDSAENRRAIETELRAAVQMFDQTLSGFGLGATVVGGDGKPVWLQKVHSSQAVELVVQAQQFWQPIRSNIWPFIAAETAMSDDVIESLSNQMTQNNLLLLDVMNRLTSSLERESQSRADMLRGVQTLVFFLALMNFMVIVRRLHLMARNADRLSRHFETLATRDPLTGLFNRREFEEALGREFASAQRRTGGMAVLLMDLDGFKQVNDLFGHAAGDKVLCAVASRLSKVARVNDIVARTGGDEFVLICPDMSEERHAATLSQRLIDAINQPIDVSDGQVMVGASIGIAFYTAQVSGTEELIRQADNAMYVAKQAGRNRYVFAPAQ